MAQSPDDPAIESWQPRQRIDHRRLNALQERVITNFHVSGGHGERVVRKGNSVTLLLSKAPPAASGAFWVRLSLAASGPGMYLGKRLDVKGGFDSTGADLDTLFTTVGPEILIVNRYEGTTGTGHSLLEDPAQLDHLATWGGTTSDTPQRRIALIAGISFNDCPGDIDDGAF